MIIIESIIALEFMEYKFNEHKHIEYIQRIVLLLRLLGWMLPSQSIEA